VLGTEAEPDYAGRDPPDHVVLDKDLKSLRGPSRESRPLLDGVKFAFGGNSLRKFWGKYTRRCNRVLYREIDSHSSDRRHGVRRIADTEQSRPRPS
jgi:hypothetical protein